jgi:hypothetical protein
MTMAAACVFFFLCAIIYTCESNRAWADYCVDLPARIKAETTYLDHKVDPPGGFIAWQLPYIPGCDAHPEYMAWWRKWWPYRLTRDWADLVVEPLAPYVPPADAPQEQLVFSTPQF